MASLLSGRMPRSRASPPHCSIQGISPYPDDATMPPGLRGSPGRDEFVACAGEAITGRLRTSTSARSPAASNARSRAVRHVPSAASICAGAKIQTLGADEFSGQRRDVEFHIGLRPRAHLPGSRRHRRPSGTNAAGEDAHRFARPQRAGEGMAGWRRADHAARALIAAAHGIAIHDGDGKGGWSSRASASSARMRPMASSNGTRSLSRGGANSGDMMRRRCALASTTGNHLNMSSTRTFAARASFSATSARGRANGR